MKVCLLINGGHANTGSGLDRYSWGLISNLNIDAIIAVLGEYGGGDVLFPIKKIPPTIRILRAKADIFHVTSNSLMDPLLLSKKRRLVVTIHDLLPFRHSITSFYYKDFPIRNFHGMYSLFLARYARMIITTFNVTKIDLVKTLGFQSEKVRVVNLGVDHSHFRPLREAKKNKSTESILFIGDAETEGLDTLFQAFSNLSKEEEVSLHVGGKIDEALIQKLTKSYDVDNTRVKFFGFVPEKDLPKLYNEATVYVFPSRKGFGLSIFEAMACGTPVIASNTNDVKEILDGSALLVKPGDAWELEKTLRNVLTSPELQRKLSNKGLSQSLKFSWKRMAEETLSLYKEVLEMT